jgi:predicted nucleic acid-binding protein
VVDRGKRSGKADAFLIEAEIDNWIEVCRDPEGTNELAERAGIHAGEMTAILVAKERGVPVLLDDKAARKFAESFGLEVTGSLGIIVRAAKLELLSKDEVIETLEKISEIMWLSAAMYGRVRRVIESL